VEIATLKIKPDKYKRKKGNDAESFNWENKTNMKNYYRIRLGRKCMYASEALAGNFIGADYKIEVDLNGKLPDNWREFNRTFIPIYFKNKPDKTKIAAGLACGNLWTICKGINIGDIVLCPDEKGANMVGEVLDDYSYHPKEILPHRRTVRWFQKTIDKSELSQEFQRSLASFGVVIRLDKHSQEIESLLAGNRPVTIISTDDTVEDPSVFAMEKHLEDFLIKNWHKSELGKDYIVFEEDGELVGQQYPTDTGYIDILAISKDKKELLVVELKKGRVSDAVIGQIQRYMGYVQEELAEEGQTVKGIIIALEDDLRIRRALAVTKNIEFYRYQVSFKLFKNTRQ